MIVNTDNYRSTGSVLVVTWRPFWWRNVDSKLHKVVLLWIASVLHFCYFLLCLFWPCFLCKQEVSLLLLCVRVVKWSSRPSFVSCLPITCRASLPAVNVETQRQGQWMQPSLICNIPTPQPPLPPRQVFSLSVLADLLNFGSDFSQLCCWKVS